MFIARAKWPSKDGKKTYESVWLRESYREDGKVKTRNIANLKHCKPEEIAAIELALKHKDDLSSLGSMKDLQVTQGQSIGALWAVLRTASKLGLPQALGSDFQGKLALWQVLARVLDQGSRLSAARLAQRLPVAEVLGLSRGFDENDLYGNLSWLADRQEAIEDRLFSRRWSGASPELFLYDVTSSYLEGDRNELADYGYNRDKKRGKKQIVIGLLCDPEGRPVSTQVFEGNTSDLTTFQSQVKKAAERFGCARVTFVGDRGMVKSGQIEGLAQAGFHYITAITKGQIRSLIKKGAFQLGLFDEHLCEVEHGGERYILRRNPVRAEEMARSRSDRLAALKKLADEQNAYLADHPRADVHKAWEKVSAKESRLGVSALVTVTAKDRRIRVEVDEEYLAEVAELDGCYALRTDLPAEAASAKTIHDRYKDLALVERAFRTMKTGLLEVRPVYVRRAQSTRAHVLVVMLAYLVVRELTAAWSDLNLTVEEGLEHLKTLCTVEVGLKGGASALHIPKPGPLSAKLLSALKVTLPEVLPKSSLRVGTRKKLIPSK
ncbi:MAG: IS1634 family transposase [Thermodesulfobacteriota bacterium]